MNYYNINQISCQIFLNIQNFKYTYVKKKIQKKDLNKKIY